MRDDGAKIPASQNVAAERAFNDALARRYFNIWETFPIQMLTNKIEGRWLNERIPAGSSVLIAGSGGGREIPSLLAHGCKITAVDISPAMIEAGRHRFGEQVQWIVADLHDLPADLSGFEAVVSLGGVFNYLRDPKLCVENLARAMTPGGLLVLGVFNAEHPAERAGRAVFADGRIRTPYSVSEITAFLEDNGCCDVESLGFRYFVDLFPQDFLLRAASNEEDAELLSLALDLEERLISRLPAGSGKMLFVTGRTPASPMR